MFSNNPFVNVNTLIKNHLDNAFDVTSEQPSPSLV
jgi:hypothetical protein